MTPGRAGTTVARRRRSRPALRTSVGVLALVLLAGSLGACDLGGDPGTGRGSSGAPSTSSGSGGSAASGAGATGWTPVALPDGLSPVTVTAAPRGLLVGAYATGRPHPRLLVLPGTDGTDGAAASSVPVVPHSPYAFEARWLSVAAHGDEVVAVGGARGGAHANVRWTVWTGTTRGLTEQPQPFEVFGGWGAGDLSGAAFAGGTPVVTGGWQSRRAGNDVSLWRVSGTRWTRRDSTGSPLGSTATALNGARSVSGTGDGLVLAGSVTELAPGHVSSVPAVWTAPSPDGPWLLVRLPATAPLAEAHAARCAARRCVVVGQDGGRLAVWDVDDGRAVRTAVPDVAVGEREQLPAPVSVAGHDVVVAPGSLLERVGSGWSRTGTPEGSPTASAVQGRTLFVVTTDASGTTRLWSHPARG